MNQTRPPLEVLVVDDGSSDRTARRAAEAGASVLPSRPLPPGWRGKTWACHQGALAARGRLLLFVDADVWLESQGLCRLLGSLPEDSGALSLIPFHGTKRLYEGLSAFFNLMMAMGVGAFTVLGEGLRPAGLFGQLLLIDRDSYESSGGHRAVRGHILENMHLARRLRDAGVPIRCLGGKGTAGMRMYPGGLHQLAEGWGKAFTSGAGGVPAQLMVPIVAWISGLIACTVMPILALAGHPLAPSPWLAAYPIACAQVAVMLSRLGRFPVLSWILYPVSLVFMFAIMTRAGLRKAAGKHVRWKGRTIRGDGGEPDAG